MFTKNKLILIAGVLILSVLVYVFTPKIKNYFRWKIAVEAAGGFSYQIGLTNVAVTPCFTTGVPPVCAGGTLCYVKPIVNPTDPRDVCLNNSDVVGTPSGGMGSDAIFLNTSIAQAGLISGGQLIAGGMSPTLMNAGVLAGAGGCAGCLVHLDEKNRIKKWFYNFIIAGKRNN